MFLAKLILHSSELSQCVGFATVQATRIGHARRSVGEIAGQAHLWRFTLSCADAPYGASAWSHHARFTRLVARVAGIGLLDLAPGPD